jgi:hypothetical protein
MMGNRSPRTEKQLMAMRANAFVKGQAKHPGASSFAVGNSGNPRPGHPNRNKGGYKLTAETRAKMSKPKSLETRAKMSAAQKGHPGYPVQQSLAYRAKMSAAKKGQVVTEETRAKLSASHKAMLANNPERKAQLITHVLDVATRIGGNKRIEHLDSRGRMYKFRSTWEVKYAEALDRAGLAWFYEPDRLLLSDGRTYTPDFWIVEWNSYVEIKGDHRWQSDKVEVARNDGYSVILVHGKAALAIALTEMEK